YKKVQFAVTEYGVDGLLDGRPQPTGWQAFTGAGGYVDQLLRAGRYLERFSGRVLGYAIFTLGHNAPWDSYDIAGNVANLPDDRSEAGTWSQVTTTGSGIIPGETDNSNDPGGTHSGDGGHDDGGQPPPTDGHEGGNGSTPPPPKPLVEQRVSEWFKTYNMS